MGYHLMEIKKEKFGTLEKIQEELYEALDASQQNCKIMVGIELSDLIGAVEEYAKRELNLTLDDLIKMKDITKRAFESGHRK